jgi:hypothetical protein
MRLSEKEIKFIRLACIISDGVFDFSQSEEQFKECYGLTIANAERMTAALRIKCENELDKKASKRNTPNK